MQNHNKSKHFFIKHCPEFVSGATFIVKKTIFKIKMQIYIFFDMKPIYDFRFAVYDFCKP